MKYQFMPMFWGDLLANTLHLRTHELGAYIRLIAHAWEHQGKIAVDDLQCVARVSNFHWKKMRPRLAQFFDTVTDPINWHHHRVHSELTKAGEISNKRKDAALQMHSKSRANGHANDPPSTTTTTTTFINASLGKGSRGMSPDLGNDYRSPPRAKSDNVLAPLPERKR
jgi:uncharacterized protein YdaU (DUF1376 family)